MLLYKRTKVLYEGAGDGRLCNKCQDPNYFAHYLLKAP